MIYSMRKRDWITGLVAALASMIVMAGQGFAAIPGGVCGKTTWKLTAGQTHNAGTVTVANDSEYLYIQYKTSSGWVLRELHAWAGTNKGYLPTAPNGNPIPGQFPYKVDSLPGGTTSYTFVVPLDELLMQDIAKSCPANPPRLFVYTHATVFNKTTGKTETAWGGGIQGQTPRWHFYGSYTLCCPDDQPVLAVCETAFGYGTHVFVKRDKANPEGLPSLRITQSRWGWAFRLTENMSPHSRPLYAGAGGNDVTKGVLVGNVVIEWDGYVATVTYNLDAPYYLKEVHIYASDRRPTRVAPGRYGFADYFDADSQTRTYSQTFGVSDKNGDGSIWIIAHSVTCAPS